MNMSSRALAALAAIAVLAGCTGKKSTASTSRSAVAGPATLRDVARLTGTVEPADTIQVKSEVTQQIKRVLVKEGDFVKKGQLLFDLDREQLELKHEQFVIAVATAKLSLKAAERDLERAQVQIRNGSVSADHVQDLEIARDKAKLSLQTAELDLKSNDRDLSNTKITAPRDGQLIRLDVTEGEMAVAASSASGNVLGVIADPTRLKVVVEVSELDFPRLKLNQKVEISTESQADKLLQGTVSYIPPSAQASTSNSSVMVFKVEVTLDMEATPVKLSEVSAGTKHHREGKGGDSARAQSKQKSSGEKLNTSLVPGMTVNVDFVFVERKVDVSVPYDMVSTGSDGATKIVWVRGKAAGGDAKVRQRPSALAGDFHPKRIEVGPTDYKNYEILSGIAAGDTIFAAPDTSSKSSKGGPGGPP
jgi:RND family efflux transporter MFP subunit